MDSDKNTSGWREASLVYLQPRVIAMMFLGFSAGVPYLMVFSTLSVWLTEAGMSRTAIGFFSWVGIAYSLKVVWAPFVDHLRLPLLHRWLGRRRSWMLLSQLLVVLGLCALASGEPQEEKVYFALFAILIAFASATQDIAVDAYRIEAAETRRQGAMAATYILGYRFALLSSGAGALLLADSFGWDTTYYVIAATMLVGMVTVFAIAEPLASARNASGKGSSGPGKTFKRRFGRQAIVAPFVDFFKRNKNRAVLILIFIGLYRISDITMGVMANPFYLDSGYTKTEIAEISKLFGFFMTIAGAALGGILVVRFGITRILFPGALLIAATNLLFAAMALSEPDTLMLTLVISADNLSGGLATAAFIAYLSSLTSVAYTATQYALFSSLMTLPAKFIGGFSGLVVDAFGGYAMFFVYTSALGIPAILISYAFLRGTAKNQCA